MATGAGAATAATDAATPTPLVRRADDRRGIGFFNLDPDPYGREVEGQIRQLCQSFGISCHGYEDAVLHGAGEVLTGSGPTRRRR